VFFPTKFIGSLKDVLVELPDFDPLTSEITSVHNKLKGVAKTWIDAVPVFGNWKNVKDMF